MEALIEVREELGEARARVLTGCLEQWCNTDVLRWLSLLIRSDPVVYTRTARISRSNYRPPRTLGLVRKDSLKEWYTLDGLRIPRCTDSSCRVWLLQCYGS